MHGACSRTVQYCIPWAIPSSHREAPPHNATQVHGFILLLEFGFGSRRSSHQNGACDHWKTEYHRDARSVRFRSHRHSLPIDNINPGGYHGRTYGAMAVTKSKISYSEGVHPLMVGEKTVRCSECSKTRIAWGISHSIPVLASTRSTDHGD